MENKHNPAWENVLLVDLKSMYLKHIKYINDQKYYWFPDTKEEHCWNPTLFGFNGFMNFVREYGGKQKYSCQGKVLHKGRVVYTWDQSYPYPLQIQKAILFIWGKMH